MANIGQEVPRFLMIAIEETGYWFRRRREWCETNPAIGTAHGLGLLAEQISFAKAARYRRVATDTVPLEFVERRRIILEGCVEESGLPRSSYSRARQRSRSVCR